MGFAVVLALVIMKASLLALSSNQWTIMQTLTDAYLTRETALAVRLPVADLTAAGSSWPDLNADDPPWQEETVTLGRTAGGRTVDAAVKRFRVNETPVVNVDTGIAVWRIHSVLTYTIGEHEYFKSRSTVRVQ